MKTFMIQREFKFSEIVALTAIDPNSAQYLMKNPAVLPGMPKAGIQGTHRRFSIEQALRLAVCTELLKGLSTPTTAGAVLLHAERQYRRWPARAGTDARQLFEGAVTNPWWIKVFDRNFVALRRFKQTSRDFHMTIGQYFSLLENEFVDEIPNEALVKSVVQVNATAIRYMLLGGS